MSAESVYTVDDQGPVIVLVYHRRSGISNPVAVRRPTSAAPSTTGESRSIHVVFSIDTMSVGGTELNALRTAERLDRSRFRVTVVTLRGEGPLAARYEALGVRVVRFPIYSLIGPATIRQAFRLARFLRTERVSVVHCHDQYSNFFSVLAARLAGVPGVIASKRWLHSPKRYRVTNALGFRVASRVLANSSAVARSLEQDDHLSRDSIVVVPNFVDEAAFTPPDAETQERWHRELRLADGDLVVGIVASLTPIKDHATLLEAISALVPGWPRLRLVIVGSGPLLETLRERAIALGIADQVRFAGHLPSVPSPHFMFDVSVLCSQSEGFPNSLVEAMAAGRPIVATSVGGVPDAVHDGENGLLVPPGNPMALAGALDTVLSDPERRRRMGEVGASRARAEFHAHAVISTLESLYAELLSTNPR